MLHRLILQNFRHFRCADLDLHAGVNAFTGETGAGKSLLTTAIQFALGARANAGLLYEGEERGEVQCWFSLPEDTPVRAWLAERSLDTGGGAGELNSDDPNCVLRRVLNSSGTSRAFINGTAVAVSDLGELGALLMDLLAQGQQHSLDNAQVRLDLLDSAWDSEKSRRRLDECWQQKVAAEKALAEELSAAGMSEDERELLRWNLQELESLELAAGKIAELEQDQRRLARALDVLQAMNRLREHLGNGAESAISESLKELHNLNGMADVDALRERLESLRGTNDDILADVSSLADRSQPDEERLSQVESTLSKLDDLARKHRCELSELEEVENRLKARLYTAESADETIAKAQEAVEQKKQDYDRLASKMHQSRETAAGKLKKSVDGYLKSLALAQAELSVQLTEGADRPSGRDQCSLLFRARPSERLRPLHGAGSGISGGELSRVHLALRLACRGAVQPPLLVLDEADAGLGGAAGRKLAALIRRLGDSVQVLCVTHLAVIAAQAHQQYKVVNEGAGAEVSTLQGQARLQELARMLTGKSTATSALQAAQELLEEVDAP